MHMRTCLILATLLGAPAFARPAGELDIVLDHIDDRASCAPDELRLRRGRKLEVHAAERALPHVERDAALHEGWIKTACLEFTPTPGAGKKTAFILQPFGTDQKRSGESGFLKDHCTMTPASKLVT